MKKYAIAIERKTSELWFVEARTSYEAVMDVSKRQIEGEEPDRSQEFSRKVVSCKVVLDDDDPKLPLK